MDASSQMTRASQFMRTAMVLTKPYIREGKTESPTGDRSKMSLKKKRKISSLKRRRKRKMKSLSTKGSAVRTLVSLA
jgi:hypothetical protein